MKLPLGIEKSDWKAPAFDFIVVVLGILVAFGLNDWNSERIARSHEREYLEALLSDVQADIEEMNVNETAAFHRVWGVGEILRTVDPEFGGLRLSAHVDSLVAANPRVQDNPECVQHDPASCLLYVRSFEGSGGAFDELKNSGNLRVISNLALTDSLSRYHSYLLEVISFDNVVSLRVKHLLEEELVRNGVRILSSSVRFEELVRAAGRSESLRASLYHFYSATLQQANVYNRDFIPRATVLKDLLEEEIGR